MSFLLKLHDDFENFVEFTGGEAFGVLRADIEVASDVGEDSEVCVDRGGITFADFKICFAVSYSKSFNEFSISN